MDREPSSPAYEYSSPRSLKGKARGGECEPHRVQLGGGIGMGSEFEGKKTLGALGSVFSSELPAS